MDNLIQLISELKTEEDKGILFIHDHRSSGFLSYAGLYNSALYALETIHQNCTAGTKEVVLLLDDYPTFLIGFWACLMGRLIPIPLSTGSSAHHKEKMLTVWQQLSRPAVITTQQELIRIDTFANSSCQESIALSIRQNFIDARLIGQDATGQSRKKNMALPDPAADELAYIQFSSGSTGEPKGVMLSHGNLISNITDIMTASGITGKDKMLSWMPLTHDMGLIGVHLTGLRAKISQVLIPTPLFIRHPVLWMDTVSDQQATLLYSPNFGYQYFMSALKEKKDYKWDLQHVRIIFNGAEPIDCELCARFIAALSDFGLRSDVIAPVYGLAEASVAVSIPAIPRSLRIYEPDRSSLNIGQRIRSDRSLTPHLKLVAVGKAVPACSIRICDDQDQSLDESTVGHIQIRGANVTKGYYDNPSATAAAFTPDGWLRTGDQGFLQAGELVITGRTKNIIIHMGQNYYPHDIERSAETIAGVGRGNTVAVGGRDKATGKDALLLFVQHKKDAATFLPLLPAIQEKLADTFGITADQIIPIRKIPRTTSGKIRHFELLAQYENGDFTGICDELNALRNRDAATHNPVCSLETMANLLHATSGRSIDPSENFFAAGLDSLSLTKLLLRLRQEFGITLKLQDIFEHPDLTSLQKLAGKQQQAIKDTGEVSALTEYPLSKAQQRLWVLHSSAAEVTPLNIAVAYHLTGPLDNKILREACTSLVGRHRTLWTVFNSDTTGMPVQRPIPPGEEYFYYQDLSSYPNAPHIGTAAMDNSVNRPFDLAVSPLIRFHLWKTGADQHIFLIVMHHLIGDGWSIAVILQELARTYGDSRTATGTDAGNSPIAIPAFYEWTTAADEEPEGLGPASHAYWEDKISGALPLKFPFNRAGEPTSPFSGATHSHAFTTSTFRLLHDFVRKRKFSVYTTLLSVFNALLYKYCGQPDILLLIMESGRRDHRSLDTIGYFSRLACLRTILDDRTSLDLLLPQVQKDLMEALSHGDHPFELVMGDMARKDGPAPEDLFNVLFVLQQFDEDWAISGPDPAWKVQRLTPAYNSTFADLHVELVISRQDAGVNIRYNSSVFTEDQIAQITINYENFINQLLNASASPISGFSFVPKEALSRLLHSVCTGPSRIANADIACQLSSGAVKSPDSIAVVAGHQSLTYKQLEHRSSGLANYLSRTIDHPSGVVIAVLLPRSIDLVIAVFGILKCHHAFLLLDPDLPSDRIRWMLGESSAAAILTSDNDVQRLTDTSIPIFLMDAIDAPPDLPAKPTANNIIPELGYLIFTSGTTGWPKGIAIPRRSLNNYVAAFKEHYTLTAADRVLMQSSVSFDIVIEELFPILTAGGCLVIQRSPASDIHLLVHTLVREKITILSTVPTVIESLNRSMLPSSLRILISGGEPLRENQIDGLSSHIQLYNTYGPAETTVCATWSPVERQLAGINIGKPVDNTIVVVADSHYQPALPGMAGELCIAGDGLAWGYLNMPELTAERFVYLPWLNTKAYTTGDIGFLTPEGNFQYLGRKDQQVKVSGVRIEPLEIEKVLERSPEVRQAAVMPRIMTNGKPGIIAFYVSENANLSLQSLRQHCSKYLPLSHLPQDFIRLTEMPVLTSGKIDRQRLNGFLIAEQPAHSDPDAQTPAESLLITALSKILPEIAIRPDDNFFALGGDSIKAMRLIRQLHDLGYTLKLQDLLEAPAIRDIAEKITAAERSGRQLSDQEIDCITWAESSGNHPTLYVTLKDPGYFTDISSAVASLLRKPSIFWTKYDAGSRELFISDPGPAAAVPEYIYKEAATDADVATGLEQAGSLLQKKLSLEQGRTIKTGHVQFTNGKAALAIATHRLLWDTASWRILLSTIGDSSVDHNALLTAHFHSNLALAFPLPERRRQTPDAGTRSIDRTATAFRTSFADPSLVTFLDKTANTYNIANWQAASLTALCAFGRLINENSPGIEIWSGTDLYSLAFTISESPWPQLLANWKEQTASLSSIPDRPVIPAGRKSVLRFEYIGRLCSTADNSCGMTTIDAASAGMRHRIPAGFDLKIWTDDCSITTVIDYDSNLFKESQLATWSEYFKGFLHQMSLSLEKNQHPIWVAADFDTVRLDQHELLSLFADQG